MENDRIGSLSEKHWQPIKIQNQEGMSSWEEISYVFTNSLLSHIMNSCQNMMESIHFFSKSEIEVVAVIGFSSETSWQYKIQTQ